MIFGYWKQSPLSVSGQLLKSSFGRPVLASCLLLLIFGGGQGWAQEAASLTGTVRDPAGATIPAATVVVSEATRGVAQNTTTNAAGAYLVAGLVAGTYTLTISDSGFSNYRAEGIVLRAGQSVRVDVVLQIAAAASQVTVSGTNIGQVETQTAELAGTVTGKETTNLVLNGRNFTQLVTLVPGVTDNTGQQEGQVGVNANISYSINGGRGEHNNWEIDGSTPEDNGSNNTLTVYPSVDAIAETRVLTSNYGAQYGRNASGTVLVETKSGTTSFHGDAYEFVRNTDFNARNFFDAQRSPYQKNDFGFTIGGPVYIPGHYNTGKDKTFFFWSEEWRKERDPNTFYVRVPSLAERQGNFNDVCPGTDCPKNPLTGMAFPNNQVPISPSAAALLPLISTPNSGSGATSFDQSSFSTPMAWREELFRVDQNISSRLRAYFRFIHDSWSTDAVPPLWTGSSFPTVETNFVGPGVNAVAHVVATVSPHLLDEFVADYTADHIYLSNIGPVQLPSNSSFAGLFNNGFGGVVPGISVCCNTSFGGSFSQTTGRIPWNNANPTYHFGNQVTQVAGNHNLIWGLDYITAQHNDLSPIGLQPSLSFNSTSPNSTGNGFADLLTGQIAQITQSNVRPKYYENYKIGSLFLQDDWRVAKTLTVNLGLRAEFYGPYTEIQDKNYNLNLGAFQQSAVPTIDVSGAVTGAPGALVPGSGNPFNGIFQCGVQGPAGCQHIPVLNWAPRFGFAWDPFGNGRTSIRGGYGIYYDHSEGNSSYVNLEGSPPLVLTSSAFNLTGYGAASAAAGLQFPLNVSSLPINASWPYVQQWNLSVQRELGRANVFTAAYVGSKGTNLEINKQLNQLTPLSPSENPFSPGEPLTSAVCASGMVNGSVITGNASANLNVACGHNSTPYLPYIGYGTINSSQYAANSSYNALQLSLRRNAGPLDLSAAYTWSHSLDDVSNGGNTVFNSYNVKSNWANSDFNQPQSLKIAVVYSPTLFRNNRWIGGWQLSALVSAVSGLPFTVSNGTFTDNAGVDNGGQSFPDLVGNPQTGLAQTNVAGVKGPLLFNPSAFAAPQGLTFGNGGRNTLRLPGYSNFDLGVFKNFKITERQYFEFRVEGFNALNQVQWASINSKISCYGGPDLSAGDSSCSGSGFLQPTSARLGRILQLGLKFVF